MSAGRCLTKDPARCSGDDMLPIVQFPNVFSYVGSSNAGMALHTHIVPQSKHHLGRGGRGGGALGGYLCWGRSMEIKILKGLYTFWICTASSLVGESTSICVSLSWISTF